MVGFSTLPRSSSSVSNRYHRLVKLPSSLASCQLPFISSTLLCWQSHPSSIHQHPSYININIIIVTNSIYIASLGVKPFTHSTLSYIESHSHQELSTQIQSNHSHRHHFTTQLYLSPTFAGRSLKVFLRYLPTTTTTITTAVSSTTLLLLLLFEIVNIISITIILPRSSWWWEEVDYPPTPKWQCPVVLDQKMLPVTSRYVASILYCCSLRFLPYWKLAHQ